MLNRISNLPAIINRHDFQYKHYFITQDKKNEDRFYLYLWAYEPSYMEVSGNGYIQAYQKYGYVSSRHRYSCTVGQETWTSDNNTNALLYSDLVETLIYNNFTLNFGDVQFEENPMPDDRVVPAAEPEFPAVPNKGDFQYKHYFIVQNKNKLESYDLYLWAYEPIFMDVSEKGYIQAYQKYGYVSNRHRYTYTIGQKAWGTNNITNSLLFSDLADTLVYNNFMMDFGEVRYEKNPFPDDQVIPAVKPDFPAIPSKGSFQYKHYIIIQNKGKLESYDLFLWAYEPAYFEVSEKGYIGAYHKYGAPVSRHRYTYTIGQNAWGTNNVSNSLLYNDFADALVHNNFELNVSSDYYARNDQPNDQIISAQEPEFPQLPVISGAENSFRYYFMSQDPVVLERYTLYLLKEKPYTCRISEKDIVYFLDAEDRQVEMRRCTYTVGALTWSTPKTITGINSGDISHFIDFCNFDIKADDLSTGSEGYTIEATCHFYANDGVGIGSVRNGWTKVNGKSYYYENGIKFFGWLADERSRAVVSSSCYLDEKMGGMMVTSGPKYIKKSHHFFDESGIMATSDRTIGNKTFAINNKGEITRQKPECESYIARTNQNVEVFDNIEKEYPQKVATFEQGGVIKAVVPNVFYTKTTNGNSIQTVYVKVYYDGQKKGWVRKSLLREYSWAAESSGDYDPNGNNISEEILTLMKEKYKNENKQYDNVRKMYDEGGLCIFAFEGKGNNTGESSEKNLHLGGKRYGAMMVVTIGNKVEFVTYEASTLPAKLNGKISEDGVFHIQQRRHQDYYAAFQLNKGNYIDTTSTGKDANGNPVRIDNKANGVNIHTAPDKVGNLYSEVCHTINSKDYLPFLYASGLVDKNDPMAIALEAYGTNIESSIKFRGENAYAEAGEDRFHDKSEKRYARSIDIKELELGTIPEEHDIDPLQTCSAKRDALAEDRVEKRGESHKLTPEERLNDYYFYMELLCGMSMNDKQGYYVVDRTKMPKDQKLALGFPVE